MDRAHAIADPERVRRQAIAGLLDDERRTNAVVISWVRALGGTTWLAINALFYLLALHLRAARMLLAFVTPWALFSWVIVAMVRRHRWTRLTWWWLVLVDLPLLCLTPFAWRGESAISWDFNLGFTVSTPLLLMIGAQLAVDRRLVWASGICGGAIVITSVSVAGHVNALPLAVLYMALALTVAVQVSRRVLALIERLTAERDRARADVAERSRELADALQRLSQSPSPSGLKPGDAIESEDRRERYRVLRKLGAGGMGEVHEVERLIDRKRLALKTLRGRVDTEAMARFAREAHLAAELHHPNLVPVYDVGVTASGTLFLVMELIEGGSLESERKRFGDARWALPLLGQIAGGLEAMHTRGIIHRDLKPANVLLSRGVPRIADFGLAVLRNDDALADTAAAATLSGPDSPPLTRAGAIIGTPFYMAPELVTGAREARASADVFAFGVMAYQMVSGRAPFVEAPLMAKLAGKPLSPAAPLSADGLGAAPALIERCLALDPAARPSAAELRALGQ